MPASDPNDVHLQRLRQWRNKPERDLGLGFLKKYVKQEIEKPYKQLGALVKLWGELVPAELVAHTRLEGVGRGVLRVAVDSSAHLFELDRLLRGGLEQRLITEHKGPAFRRVQLRVAGIESSGRA
jgi:hypothetical protein